MEGVGRSGHVLEGRRVYRDVWGQEELGGGGGGSGVGDFIRTAYTASEEGE